MSIKVGQIVKNLIPSEPVSINVIQEMGDMVSVTYTGINSKKVNNIVIEKEVFETLEFVTDFGTFNFKGDPVKFSLYAEAERINSAYQFDPLFAVNCSIIDPLPHQVEAVYKYLLPLPKIRFLLADDTGAGKTIMTGILLKEMMLRGIVERILIITPGGLTKQWQEDEMGLKFNIPFKLVNRAVFQSDPNIFSVSPRLITSIDFIRNEDVLNVVKETSWDIVIVDEAHKLSAFDYGQKKYKSKRYRALEVLAPKCEHLLLLTATPHRGRKDTFKNLLQIIDEDIFASDSLVTSRVREISEKGVNKFFIRRLKEQMKDWKGKPLFKARHTKTTMYELTPGEKRLYDRVTEYLLRKRQEASRESNIHVSLALMVMQRRLTSSIYAITRTLRNRYNALCGLIDELTQNPGLWKQKLKPELSIDSLDDYDEFDDEERESLETILSDPRKFRMFTTAKNMGELKEEASQVKELVGLAEALHNSGHEEQKFKKLRELLMSEGVFDNKEKLVIFTEHRDTLTCLYERLKNNGYNVVTIHGGMNVYERRAVQAVFAKDAQILVATDAAGEGINLQFCRLLINWDIPWNPNRLEQRMGRIHRYKQQNEVIVFNLAAQDTLEGRVLEHLLKKLEQIREQIGDDRVYDVISDIFEGVSLDDIINATFNGKHTAYNETIDAALSAEHVRQKIKEQKECMGYSLIDYKEARLLKEHSDEIRLQPIYIRLFFEKAFKALGGRLTQINESVYTIDTLPEQVSARLKREYNISYDITELLLCFDKAVFLDYQTAGTVMRMHYINPGNPVFDSLVHVILKEFREEMLKGTILISPFEKEDYFSFLIKSQVCDSSREGESVADERIVLVEGMTKEDFRTTLPSKLIDLHPPGSFAKDIRPPEAVHSSDVIEWSFITITAPQFERTKKRVEEDVERRKAYLEEAFNTIMFDLTAEINELQGKVLLGDQRAGEKIEHKQKRIAEMTVRKKERMNRLDLMKQLIRKPPEVLGCAYVVPLNQVEYKNHFGMSRDDEAEMTAMEAAMRYEREQGWKPEDVSGENAGYDIRSTSPEEIKRYIEVKGRNGEDGIMLSENEMNRLSQLGESAWLYIVINCRGTPELFRIQNPAKTLVYEVKTKGIQYFIALEEWRKKAEG